MGFGRGHTDRVPASESDLQMEQSDAPVSIRDVGMLDMNYASTENDETETETGFSFARMEEEPTEAYEPSGANPGGASRAGRKRVRSEIPYRGRYVRPKAPDGTGRDLALMAALPNAAFRAKEKGDAMALKLTLDEIPQKARVQRVGRLYLFCVDISGSMGVELMKRGKSISLALLQQAYADRSRVSMVAFRERTAELLFAPTNQAARVNERLAGLECGGATPLALGLALAYSTLDREMRKQAGLEPVLILITDGRANVGSRPGHEAALDELDQSADALATLRKLKIIFLDATEEGKDDRRAIRLAQRLHADRIRLHRLNQGDATEAILRCL